MAASNRHRKLIPDSTNGGAVVVQFCITQCDPQENPAGLCIPTCSVICPSFCRIVDLSPPPSSSSATPVSLPYPPSTPPKHHQPPLPLPFKISLIVIAATFSLFLLYSLYKFYTVWHRFRRHHTGPPPPRNHGIHDDFLDHDVLDHPIWYIRTVGLQPSVINAITVVKFSKDNGVVEDTDCSVCLSEFQADETLRLLPNCNHAFHISCIDTWLTYHTNCPLCRAGIVNSTVDSTSPEQNTDDLGTTEETHLGISILGDDNPEENSESSELRNGGTDEQDQNNAAKAEVVGGCGGMIS